MRPRQQASRDTGHTHHRGKQRGDEIHLPASAHAVIRAAAPKASAEQDVQSAPARWRRYASAIRISASHSCAVQGCARECVGEDIARRHGDDAPASIAGRQMPPGVAIMENLRRERRQRQRRRKSDRGEIDGRGFTHGEPQAIKEVSTTRLPRQATGITRENDTRRPSSGCHRNPGPRAAPAAGPPAQRPGFAITALPAPRTAAPSPSASMAILRHRAHFAHRMADDAPRALAIAVAAGGRRRSRKHFSTAAMVPRR